MPFHQGAENTRLSHSCVSGLWSLVCRAVGRWREEQHVVPTQSGLTVGGIGVGIGQLLDSDPPAGQLPSCCGSCRGQGSGCSEVGPVELTSKACLCSAICSSLRSWPLWVPLSPWSPPLPLKLVGKAPVIVDGMERRLWGGPAGHGRECYNRVGVGLLLCSTFSAPSRKMEHARLGKIWHTYTLTS